MTQPSTGTSDASASAPRAAAARSGAAARDAAIDRHAFRRSLKRRAQARRASAVEIEGVGDLPTTMARCCGPVPPEPIAGYLTLGAA